MLASLNDLAPSQTIRRQVCIIGGGAAGIILALELDRQGVSCCIVESGGTQLDPDTQALYQGTNTGLDYHSLDASRLRFFGGSTNHWTGWTRPLDEIDFEHREWIANSGWPFPRSELIPFYERAQGYFQIGYHVWDPLYWSRKLGEPILETGNAIETVVVRHSPPTRFSPVWGPKIQASRDIACLLHANVTDISLNQSANTVEAVMARSLGGKAVRVEADQFVLATGGIENARLLLNNRKQQPTGIGNQHDQVGRYFADHRGAVVGDFLLNRPPAQLAFYPTRRVPDAPGLTAGFRLSDATQKARQLPNAGLILGNMPELLPHDSELPSPLARPGQDTLFQLLCSVEPVPNPASRVTLAAEKDALGMQKVDLHLAIGSDWHEGVRRSAAEFARQWTMAGMGSARLSEDHPMPSQIPGYGDHHMGTTRMSDSPKHGVVDRDCRVHGMGNLYIAGSSVFPNYGYAQPTFTIGALTLRLAKHLSGRFP